VTAIRFIGGAHEGTGSYELGVLHLPGGGARAVEEVVSVTVQGERSPAPRWSGEIVRGLQGALAQAGGLRQPLGLAASMVGAGLGLFDRTVRFTAAFADGTSALIEAEAGLPALIDRDREIVRLARLRQAPAAEPAASPENEEAGKAADSALSAVFEYEKRNGRLRRVAAPKRET
jgi:hypothetical protein